MIPIKSPVPSPAYPFSRPYKLALAPLLSVDEGAVVAALVAAPEAPDAVVVVVLSEEEDAQIPLAQFGSRMKEG